jgi:hypothetical protein
MAVEDTPSPSILVREVAGGALADLLVRCGQEGAPAAAPIVERARAARLDGGRWLQALAVQRLAAAEDVPLVTAARALGLSPIETLSVALIAALDEDPLLGAAVALAQSPAGGTRPTLGLLAALFAELAPDQVAIQALAGGAALASGLLRLDGEGRPLSERTPGLRPPIYLALCGRDGAWPGAEIGLGDSPPVPLARSVLADAERRAAALTAAERALVIRTASPTEGRAVAAAVAAALGTRALFLERDVPDGLAPYLLLRDLVPVFCYDLGPGERRRIPLVAMYGGPLLAVAGLDGVVQTPGSGAPDWVVGVPPRDEREQLWLDALEDQGLARELAREHRHPAGRIAHLGRVVRHQMLVAQETRPTRAHVAAASWVGEDHGLAGLAQPLRDAVPDDALVTNESLRAELELLLLRCRARDSLADGLGASVQARYRPGVRALFVGPSGTGKTLAAGWLSTRLGIPLYRVDLAAVTSKYIGETEKNLAQLLARAEYTEVILLFDEADSMFGKRTDVKEANDRFANAQTNYLLTRIESFDGITILTSNSRNRFDSSFTRRLDAVLDFALPGPEERRGLWLSHLGRAHALEPRTINKLAAMVDLTGGHIRNVVLAAAVVAGSNGRPIAYGDILTGLGAELRKLGRQLPPELRHAE